MTVLYQVPKLIIWAMTTYVLFMALQDLQLGGNEWKQGDWLINNAETFIRRGIFGSVILSIALAFSVDPVLVVVSLQAFLVCLVILLLSLSVRKFRYDSSLWLLILSPGFFISLWAMDPQGGLRKELVVFLAFALLLFAITRSGSAKFLVYLSAAVLCIAFMGHEGNVFFLPFFWFCYVMMLRAGRLGSGDILALCGVSGAAALMAVALAFLFGNVADYRLVCQPLLDAGSRVGICDGAIKALEIGLSDFVEATFWMALSPRMLAFLLMYGLTAISILIIGAHFFERKRVLRFYVVSALIFLPLYIVAVDWGRWLSFHTTAVIFVGIIMLALDDRKERDRADLPILPFAGLLVFSIVWGTSHFVYVEWGGILWKSLNGLMRLTLGA